MCRYPNTSSIWAHHHLWRLIKDAVLYLSTLIFSIKILWENNRFFLVTWIRFKLYFGLVRHFLALLITTKLFCYCYCCFLVFIFSFNIMLSKLTIKPHEIIHNFLSLEKFHLQMPCISCQHALAHMARQNDLKMALSLEIQGFVSAHVYIRNTHHTKT